MADVAGQPGPVPYGTSGIEEYQLASVLTGDHFSGVTPAISAWEVAMLAKAGRLALIYGGLVGHCCPVPTVRLYPLMFAFSVHSVDCPASFIRLADRIVVATTWRLSAPLVSADLKIARLLARAYC